ncbi:TPA: hypothetical protein ACGTPR_000837 [Salmonella enterica]
MATVLNIVIESKNGRIETVMSGGGKGDVTQGGSHSVNGTGGSDKRSAGRIRWRVVGQF